MNIHFTTENLDELVPLVFLTNYLAAAIALGPVLIFS